MPKMYKKNIVYTVPCTVHCTLYCTVYTVWPKSCICHYFHGHVGGGGGGGGGVGDGGVSGGGRVGVLCGGAGGCW